MNEPAQPYVADYEMCIPLRTTDFDRFTELKPSAVLQLFQEAATRQAEEMGIGFGKMFDKGVLWAVIRTRYDVLEQPRLYDEILVRTWPHDPSKFSFLRDYTIKDSNGNLLVKGTSEWVLMSREDRSFVSLLSVYNDNPVYLEDRNYSKKPRKLRNFDHEGLEPCVICPPYSTVDLNGHVNNANYADLLLDAISPHEGHSVKSFQIDYRREVHEGEPLQIYTCKTEDGLEAKGLDAEGNVMFAAHIEV